jgi:hypothetical protein
MPVTGGIQLIRNGKAYDSADVDINIDGEMFPGVSKIEYSVKENHQKNFSLKQRATSWSKGQIEETGKLEMYMEDIVKLQKKGGGSLLGLKPFYTIVTFTNDDQEVVVDRVYWKFTTDGRTIDGGMGLKMEHEMFTIGIELNV